MSLKPCQFCGGKASIDKEYDMDGFGNFHRVECTKCGAQSKSHFTKDEFINIGASLEKSS